MRILYAGSPGIAAPVLELLAEKDAQETWELAGVLTNPDTPRGRSGKREPTDLAAVTETWSQKQAAQGRPPIPIIKAETLDAQTRALVAALKPELLVSFAYGRIFGPQFLSLFPLGGINIHPSLLPKYRGPTPIQAAILNRDAETGLSIQRLALTMDSGDILAQERLPLTGEETTETLSAAMSRLAVAILPGVLRGLNAGILDGRPQNHAEASFCGLITKDDGRIDWKRSAWELDAQIRAFTPPLCLTIQESEVPPESMGDSAQRELYILAGRPYGEDILEDHPRAEPGRILGIDKNRGILIQTGNGVYGAERLQYRTKKALDWRAFLNGAPDFAGSRLI